MSIFEIYAEESHKHNTQEMSVEEYLELCKYDPMAYATSAERLLHAIGEPELLDTSTDPVLSRKYQNRTIQVYPAFSDFYGIEYTIERIVGFFKYAAQGLEEKKQVLYLLGPVGSSKSSLAERIKLLMERFPIYALKADDEISPIYESPLGLFSAKKFHKTLLTDYDISDRYLTHIPSPWALKRLHEYNNDISRFSVIKIWPNILNQIAISKTEPGDENNQDISSLVGKVDIRKLGHLSQSDADAYSFSGGLCKGNQGIMEFVEMFKAPIKVLHPLLTATQEGNYNSTEDGLGAIPFNGTILAHSNESEWSSFKADKKNEAFLDRIFIVKVPYCLSKTDEVEIYKKMLHSSNLHKAPCAPKTLELLAEFSVLSRLSAHENSSLITKMKIYDGDNMKDKDPKSRSLQEYKDVAGVSEGMSGMSTRFAFKVLSQTFNFDHSEVAADPVHLMHVLERAIKQEQYPAEEETRLLGFIKDYMVSEYKDFISHEIQKSYLESYSDYGQALFDKYVMYADHWIQDTDYKDADTGQMFDRKILNTELEKIEKPAGIANPKDFRHDIVNFVLRAKADNGGGIVAWHSYENMREVIEKKMFSSTEDLLPVISYSSKSSSEEQNKHEEFIKRMAEKGYTSSQCQRAVEWYLRLQKD